MPSSIHLNFLQLLKQSNEIFNIQLLLVEGGIIGERFWPVSYPLYGVVAATGWGGNHWRKVPTDRYILLYRLGSQLSCNKNNVFLGSHRCSEIKLGNKFRDNFEWDFTQNGFHPMNSHIIFITGGQGYFKLKHYYYNLQVSFHLLLLNIHSVTLLSLISEFSAAELSFYGYSQT